MSEVPLYSVLLSTAIDFLARHNRLGCRDWYSRACPHGALAATAGEVRDWVISREPAVGKLIRVARYSYR